MARADDFNDDPVNVMVDWPLVQALKMSMVQNHSSRCSSSLGRPFFEQAMRQSTKISSVSFHFMVLC
jgi:hypothetical protein